MIDVEKEIQQMFLSHEKDAYDTLQGIYLQSLIDVKEKMRVLDKRVEELLKRPDYDASHVQSILFQYQYFEYLESQINGIVDQLEYETGTYLRDYITEAYTDGYISANYVLNHQDIPIITPVDMDQVLLSVNRPIEGMTFSQRNRGNMNDFKQKVKTEVTKGIVQSLSYHEISKNLSRVTEESLYKSMRIARTEGHRVQNEATFQQSLDAQDRGCDIIKVWNSTLDGRTRNTHQKLDNQVRELEEHFDSPSGAKALYPAGFGIASEDINCRCFINRIPRWALDDEARERMAEINGVQQLVSVHNYEEYKSRYLTIIEQAEDEAYDIRESLLKQETVNKAHQEAYEEAHSVALKMNLDYDHNQAIGLLHDEALMMNEAYEKPAYKRFSGEWDDYDTDGIEAVLLEAERETSRKLTVAQKESVRRYTGNAFDLMNAVERGEKEIWHRPITTEEREEMKTLSKNLKGAMKKFDLTENITVYRGDKMKYANIKTVDGREIYKVNQFHSTSIWNAKSDDFGSDLMWELQVDKGVKCMYVDGESANNGEREMIFPKGTIYEIQEVIPNGYTTKFGAQRTLIKATVKFSDNKK